MCSRVLSWNNKAQYSKCAFSNFHAHIYKLEQQVDPFPDHSITHVQHQTLVEYNGISAQPISSNQLQYWISDFFIICAFFFSFNFFWYHQLLVGLFLFLPCTMEINIRYSNKPRVFLHSRSVRSNCKIKLPSRRHVKNNGKVIFIVIAFWTEVKKHREQHVVQISTHTFTSGDN